MLPPQSDAADDFGKLLRALREERGFSGRALAHRAEIQQSQYSDYENGHRRVGSKIAERLADALELTGDDREAFVHRALLTGRRPRVGEEFQFYHPAILQAVAARLRVKHITSKMILTAVMRPMFRPGDEEMLKALERLASQMALKAKELHDFVEEIRQVPAGSEPMSIPTDLMGTLDTGKFILVDVTVVE